MFIERNARFTIYFGDAAQSVSLDEVSAGQTTPALQNIMQQVQAKQIALLRQEHGVQGKIIELSDDQNYIFQPAGDYLITQKINYGIGVVTADCVPIVIYDPVNHAAGIVHAGWKGLLAGVFEIAVADMILQFGSRPEDLQIYLGPSARPCCYEVQQDFVDQFKKYEKFDIDTPMISFSLNHRNHEGRLPLTSFLDSDKKSVIGCNPKPFPEIFEKNEGLDYFRRYAEALQPSHQSFGVHLAQEDRELFITKEGKIYFDSRSFIMVIARSLGIVPEKLYTRYNLCTICNLSFCSYRREKEKARRQVTMISLHEAVLLREKL